jgi:hypothetical protein
MAENATRNSTNVIEVIGLRDRTTGEYVDDATVLATLYDALNNPVAGATNLTLTLVAGTIGSRIMYRGSWPSTVALTLDASYTLKVTPTAPGPIVREFVVDIVAVNG